MARAEAIDGPRFRQPSPDGPLLQEAIVGYERITGVPVKRPKKRNYIASCYRVHGPNFLPLVAQLFAETGTEINLLREVRRRPAGSVASPRATGDRPRSTSQPLAPIVTARPIETPWAANARHGANDRDSFDGAAAGFFSDDELLVPTDRPAVRAITR